jgi:hypothetical protein
MKYCPNPARSRPAGVERFDDARAYQPTAAIAAPHDPHGSVK